MNPPAPPTRAEKVITAARTYRGRRAKAAWTSLKEAAPSNLTVTRRDGTIVYREDRLK